MLKKIKLIQGIGNFTRMAAGSINLGEVTVIYGENRNGKSTLCDVMQSLAENSPDYILNRKTIPHNANNRPKVELMFKTESGNLTSVFDSETWQSLSPECSKLYVFDHSFIHRNVINGQRQERPNSESMTSFILGENSIALYEALAELNTATREERRNTNAIEAQFGPYRVRDISAYANSSLPAEEKSQLERITEELESEKLEKNNTLKNIESIRKRDRLDIIASQVNFQKRCEELNKLLASNLDDIHKDSLTILQNHMNNHVINPTEFKGWASNGVSHIKDDCPFCGQELTPSSLELVEAYKQAFNHEFDNFNQDIKHRVNSLRQPFELRDTRETIIHRHESNRQVFELYVEPEVTNHPEYGKLTADLQYKFERVLTCHDALFEESKSSTERLQPILDEKYSTPYKFIDTTNFDSLILKSREYNQALYEYFLISKEISEIFQEFKDSLSKDSLEQRLREIFISQNKIKSLIQRIDLEPICDAYRKSTQKVAELQDQYDEQKNQLDQSQSDYLENYFSIINSLFMHLGSRDFEIIKTPNNRGKKVIYDLRVKFKGEDIPTDKINSVFSESDRRSLALCIFLAKIVSLPDEERSKAILILDDPVTSFDNERITRILNKLVEIKNDVKQLVITTHYKGMASKTVKKFGETAVAIRLFLGAETSELENLTHDQLTATDHDLNFDKINSFINRESDEDISRLLRPFFEEEIRHRFKRQLLELGASNADLASCISILCQNGHIDGDIEGRLNTMRADLNSPMHSIESSQIEDIRAIAEDLFDLIYNCL